MASVKQIEANRRNALRSTGPKSTNGKMRSRSNALRHGLTSETVIFAIEDAEDYQAFEAAVIADYDVETAVERELVLRLASLLWRLRRAGAIETSLFEHEARLGSIHHPDASNNLTGYSQQAKDPSTSALLVVDHFAHTSDVARAFVQIMRSPHCPLDRLSRYEANLWRQATNAMYLLAPKRHRKRTRTARVFGVSSIGPRRDC